MRTAEEILNKNYYSRQDPEVDFDTLVDIINEARKEAIEECAEKVRIKWIDDDYDEEKRDMNCHPEIDKESILSLINKLK